MNLAAELAVALNRLATVRALHRRATNGPQCEACGRSWPCPTIGAADGVTEPETGEPCVNHRDDGGGYDPDCFYCTPDERNPE